MTHYVKSATVDIGEKTVPVDAAGRLRRVFDDAGNWLSDDAYGSGRQRVFRNSGVLTWYVWGGDSVLAEYTSTSWGGTYTWAKSYIYAGSRLLFTATNNGAGGELKEYHHPDRLGTRMVTDPAANTLYLQSTLPFGTQFDSETTGSSNRLFTSYDRSAGTGLDYAVNRTYSSGQGRFTSVDPIGMASTSLGNPQSFNLYAYVLNNPIDFVDPSGLMPQDIIEETDLTFLVETIEQRSVENPVGISEQVQIDNPPGTEEGPTDGGGGGDPTDGGTPGVSLPPVPPTVDDPNGQFCQSLLRKINNLEKSIARRINDLLINPQRLPDEPPYPGAPARASRQGHGPLIDAEMDKLRERRETYRQRCGGNPPPSGPAPVPVPVPRPNTRPGVPRAVPRSIPLVPVPVKPVLPIFVFPPGWECVYLPQLCGNTVIT